MSGKVQVSRYSHNKSKFPSRKKLKAALTQGISAVNLCRIFCLPVCYPKI